MNRQAGYTGDAGDLGRIPVSILGERMDGTAEKTITAIEQQVRRKDRVSIFLDGQFTVGVHAEVAAALFLGVGQRISEERLKEIVRAETLAKARDRAFLLLSYRPRTEKEVRDRLARAEYDEDIIEEVIAKLYELDFLNDKAFAERFVENRMAARPVGRRALTWELRKKGLDAETVADAAASVDDETEREGALAAARSRAGRLAGLDRREARRKLTAFLQRRGFTWDTIHGVLDEILPSGDAG
jgi:regulatory protein